MSLTKKLIAALALATALFLAAGGLAAQAAPMPTGILAWEVTASKVLSDTDSTSYSGNVQIDAKDSSNNPIVLDLNGKSVTISGNLTIFGTLFVDNGTLTVTGNVQIMNGTLKMTDTASKLTVKGNFSTDGADETGLLTAGTLLVYGDFMQYGDFSHSAFCPSGTFTTTLSGTGKYIYFETPDGSWFSNILPNGGNWYKTSSVFSFKFSLASETTFTYPNLYIQGALNGNILHVPDKTTVAGALMMGGGKLFAAGALTVAGNGTLGMENSSDYVEVKGDFTAGGHSDYKNGVVTITGNFYQYSILHNSSYHDDSYACLPTHKTVLVGLNKTVVFDTPGSSYFGQLDNSQATFTSISTISLNTDLTADATWTYPNLYYGGRLNGHNLTVADSTTTGSNGDLHARTITLGGGSLTVKGNFTSASNNCLVMTNAADSVVVKKNFTASYAMDPTALMAGTLEIDGNFYQITTASSFTASGSHVTKLVGANKYVSFSNPGTSYFNRLNISGASFTAQSTLAIKCDLASDLTIAIPTLYYSGSLGGHTLSVTGALHLFGSVNPQGGVINGTGSVSLDGALTMAQNADSLVVGGDFTGSGTAALSAGTAEFKKSFTYSGTSYNASGTHLTVLSGGSGMTVKFDHPDTAWFSQVSIPAGTTLSAGSAVSLKLTGLQDITLSVPALYVQGDLKGHSLTLTGDLTVPAGQTLTLSGGTVRASGGVTLIGLLEMKNAADRVYVGGTFTAEGPDESGKLTDGILTVSGDFIQHASLSGKSFAASATSYQQGHATVLDGAGPQTVTFDTPGTALSTFGRLYRMNQAIYFASDYYTTGTGTPPLGAVTSAYLSSLDGTGGALTPAFSPSHPDLLNYVYVLPAGATSATITAHVKDSSLTTVTMDGTVTNSETVTGVGYGGSGNKTVDIAVSAVDGIVVNHYIVKVEQLDADLSGIALSTGSLSPAFSAGQTTYSVSLPASVDSITVTPALDNPDASCTISGRSGSASTYRPYPGQTIAVPIAVTGQDGATQKIYTVNITRAPMISGVTAASGSDSLPVTFTAPQSYTVTMDAQQGTATLHVQGIAGSCDTLTIDGVTQPDPTAGVATVQLSIGGTKIVPVVATCGSATFTYQVTVQRNSIISGFGAYPSGGTVLSPDFSGAGGSFTLTIPASMHQISITPVREDCTSLTINGSPASTVDVSPAVGGSQTVTIVATDGTGPGSVGATFTLTVVRKPILTALTLSDGNLSPAFSPTTLAYTVEMPATMDPFFVTPTLASGTAYIGKSLSDLELYDPQSPDYINPLLDPDPGTSGGSTATLYVKVQDGSASVVYTVSINRQKPITAITTTGGTLAPAFDASTGDYVVNIPAYTGSVIITPTKSATCTAMTINGFSLNQVTLAPPIGGSATAVICATGPDHATISTYTVVVIREALLSDLLYSSGTISPAFQGGVSNYSIYVPETMTSVTISPQKSGSCASFLIDSKNVSKLTLKPPAGGSVTATIDCTGTGFAITQQYKVTVYRIEPVTSIKLSAGTLSPSFSMSKSAYTVNVPASAMSSTTSLTITPQKGASCATLKIDGAVADSKTLKDADLPIGCSKTVTITATAVDGRQFSYTLTVNRLALLKGITLPEGYSLVPAFSVTNLDYTIINTQNSAATLPTTTSSFKITGVKGAGEKSMKINGKSTSAYTLSIAVGATVKVPIVVSDGKISQTYSVTVKRDPLITALGTSAGVFTTAFNPTVLTYAVNLPADTAGTTLTATPFSGPGVQSITMNGAQLTSLPVTVPAPGGSVQIPIVATASDGKTKVTYTVTVVRNPIIQKIEVTGTGAAITPVFNPLTDTYTVSVPVTTKTVTLKVTPGPDCLTTKIGGINATSASFDLPIGGGQTVDVVGTTAGSNSSTYHIRLYRAALVSNIKTSSTSYPLTPAFDATKQNYVVTLPASKSSVTISVTKGKGVGMLTIDGHQVSSRTYTLKNGCSTTVVIKASASADISMVSQYTITIVRPTLVDGITATGGTLAPAFDKGTHTYAVSIPAAQSSVKFDVTKSALAGTVKINGTAQTSFTATPAAGKSVTVTITVYVAGSTTVKDTYTIVVTRAAT